MLSDATLRELIARGERRFPAVHVDAAKLGAHLARHGVTEEVARSDRGEELFLACAAGLGDAAAVRVLQRQYLPRIDAALAHLRGASSLADDVRGRLAERLFVAAPGAQPRILDFAGKSDLVAWLRACAVRQGLDLLRGKAAQASDDPAILERVLPVGDPAMEQLKRHDAPLLKEALRDALAALPDEARELVRQYYFEGLGVEALGAVHQVAPSTISRRVARARVSLLEALRERLVKRLKLQGSEVDSFIRAVASQLELSRSSF